MQFMESIKLVLFVGMELVVVVGLLAVMVAGLRQVIQTRIQESRHEDLIFGELEQHGRLAR